MKRWSHLSVAILTILIVIALSASATFAGDSLNLAGTWRFGLDTEDIGVQERWFGKDLPDVIRLPGVLQAQGYGNEISTQTPWVLSLYDHFWYLRADYQAYTQPGKVKVPFLCQPPLHYVGVAWYQRDIEIPPGWQGRRVVLTLERTRWESTVWVDDERVGSHNSLVAPHVYDLGMLAAGRHRLTVRADTRLVLPYRPDAHSVSDSLDSTWNGIVGKIELKATSPVWIEDAQLFPDVAKKSVIVKLKIGNLTGTAGKGELNVLGGSVPMILPVAWDAQGAALEFEVPLKRGVETWDEFHPRMHTIALRLIAPPLRVAQTQSSIDDLRELSFGLRELHAEGNQFVLNGRPIIFRGTHHGGDFPLTGYPPTDVSYWRKLFLTCKAWGLNHMRFHSWCPPEAAFIAADEIGFYLQPEPGMWNEISPGTSLEQMLYTETDRMIKAYGNHPSFLLLSPSNEPKGHWPEALTKWIEHYRKADPRRLYTNGTGHTEREVPNLAAGTDYLAMQRIGPKMLRGPSAWFGRDYRESLADINVPVVAHELGQWVAYPDYDIIRKFTGYMRPGNYEIFRDSMAAHGLLGKDKDFAWASGRYQLECYKEEIEANLRTPGLGGFQLLDLHDYVGQGTALVGLLDAFWESKGYATPEEFRRFCNTTVPLARLKNRVLTTHDSFDVDVEVAHYGAEPIRKAVPLWKIVDEAGRVVVEGRLSARTIPLGKNTELGRIKVDLSKLSAPRAYRLMVGLQGTQFKNDWNFWLYPSRVDTSSPEDVLVTNSWDEAEAGLEAGGKVLYQPRMAELGWTSPPLDEVPVFWNRLMGPAWGRMLGLWADVKHPALAEFPTLPNFDWQWRELVRGARAVNLDGLPPRLQPIVQAIDDWNRNYKLGLIFECQVGRGRLLVSAVDLETDLDARPVARQLRRSVLDYMASGRFRPGVAVSAADLRGLLFDTRIMHKLGATATGDGQATQQALDGDPNTFWQAGVPRGPKHPYELTVSFTAPVQLSGLVLMPRQNHREHEGDIREYVIQASDDNRQWREVKRGELLSSFEPQEVRLSQTITARYLKLVALSGFGTDTTAALAELAVIYAGPKLKDAGEETIKYQRSKPATPDIDEGTVAPDKPANSTPGRKPKPKGSPQRRP